MTNNNIVEIHSEYCWTQSKHTAACTCGGLREYAASLREALDAATRERDAARAALAVAKETIKVWHNIKERSDEAWELYQHSPEMKKINAELSASTPAETGLTGDEKAGMR